MKNIKLFVFFAGTLIGFIFSNELKASHIMGGEITWTCVGHDSFIINLVLYRDCNGIPMSLNPVTFTCKSTSVLITSKGMSLPTPVDITPTCNNICTRCSNPSCSFPYGIQQFTCTGLVVLSTAGTCCEINIDYDMSSRDYNITTGAANQNFHITEMMNRCVTPCDNSPAFSKPPFTTICIGQDLVFNHVAIDPDLDSIGRPLDSLGYALAPPLQYAGSPTTWVSTYDYLHPVYFWGFPNSTLSFPRGFHLDSITGDILFRPMKIEQTIMCLAVSEYRKGVKTGEVRRDFQVIVINCPSNNAPTLGPAVYYKKVCAGSPVTFTITTNDLDPHDTLTISWNHGINGATWTDSNGLAKHPTATFTWTPDSNQASSIPYTFVVTVKDNACPIHGTCSREYQVLVNPFYSIKLTVVDSGCKNYFFNSHVTPVGSPGYSWTGSGGLNSVNKSFFFKYRKPGIYPFSLSVDPNNGCQISYYYDTVRTGIFLYDKVPNDTTICTSSIYTINSLVFNAKGNLKYHWNTGDTLHNFIIIKPMVTDTLIILTVNDSTKCPYADSTKIYVRKWPRVDAGKDTAVCDRQKLTRAASIMHDYKSNVSFIQWHKVQDTNIISSSTSVTVADSGHYVCYIADDVKCWAVDTFCLKIKPLQTVSAGKDDSVCNNKSVYLLNGLPTGTADYWTGKSVHYNTVNKNWYFDPNDTGILNLVNYPLVYHITGLNQCHNEDTLNILVHKLINFSAGKYKPQCCYNPPVQLIGSPPGGSWYVDGVSSGSIFTPSMSNIGKNQIVYNYKFFCNFSDTTELEVIDRPAITISTITGKTTFCKEQGLVQVNASPTGGPYGGYWSGSGLKGNYFDPSTGNGVYNLIYHFTDMYGCYNEDTLVLTVKEPSVHILNTEKGICKGKAIELSSVNTSDFGLTWYEDNNSDGKLTFNPFSDIALYIPGYNDLLNKFFRLFVRTNDSICIRAFDSINMNIGDYPKADFLATTLSGIPPLHVSFTDKSVLTGSLVSSYFWDFGDTSNSILQNPVHDYLHTGTYSVKLRVISEYGCEDSVVKYGYIKVTKTAVDEMLTPEIMILPNPANDFIIIKLKNSSQSIISVIIVNSVGQAVKSFDDLNAKEFRISNTGIEKGIYFLKIRLLDNTMVYRKVLFE